MKKGTGYFLFFALCSLFPPAKAAALTLTGLDVLERDGFKQLEGKRIGLITNHTSVDANGVNAVDAFHKAGNFKLAAISPPSTASAELKKAGFI